MIKVTTEETYYDSEAVLRYRNVATEYTRPVAWEIIDGFLVLFSDTKEKLVQLRNWVKVEKC